MNKLLLGVLIINMFVINAFSQDLTSAIKLTQSERYEEAAIAFEQLIKAQPQFADNYYFYGENLMLSYKADPFSASQISVAEQAKEIFFKGVKVDSMNLINYVGLGMVVLFETSDTVKADKYFNRVKAGLPKKMKKYTDNHILIATKLATAEIWSQKPRIASSIAILNKLLIFKINNPLIINAIGDLSLAQKDVVGALVNYNKALYFDTLDQSSFIKVGMIYLQSLNPNAAKEKFDAALEVDSTFAPVYKAYGALYNKTGQYSLSKNNYKKFLDLSGNNIPAKVSYANSLFKAKDYAELLNIIEEIQKIDTTRNYLNRLAGWASYDKKPADYNKALFYIESFFKNATPDKIILKDYLYYGRTLLRLKKDSSQIASGLDLLLKAYELDTTDNELFSEIGNQAYTYKRFDYSEKIIKRKIARNDASIADYLTLGKVYYQTKQYGKADTTFNIMIQKDSTYFPAYVWSANTVAGQDPDLSIGLAKQSYERVIEKGLTDSVKYAADIFSAYNYMFSYYLFVKDKSKLDYNQSLIYAQKMKNLDPKNAVWVAQGTKNISIAYFYLATSFSLKKEYKVAKDYYNKVLEIDPANEDAKKQIVSINKFLNANN